MAQGPDGGGLLGLLAGLPNPQLVMQELARLNTNLESMRPDIHVMAENVGNLHALAQGLQKFKPEDINRLISSLDRASASGEAMYQQLWGKK